MRVLTRRFPLLILLLASVILLVLIVAPAAMAHGKSKAVAYDRLTASGDCLRPFTLLGYLDGDTMNMVTVASEAAIYTVVDPSKRTFCRIDRFYPRKRLVGQYVELWDTDGDESADRILTVPRAMGRCYWDARMSWLKGVGAGSDPAVDDATGRSMFSKKYRIPMGERQLAGYGIGDWSGVTDFSNLSTDTYWPFIDYYRVKSSKTLTILSGYRTSLQVTGGTCGMASALSALDWFGLRGDLNEKDMIALRQPNTEWGGFTSLAQLTSVFTNLDKAGITGPWKLQSSFDDQGKLYDPAWLKATLAGGSPIMVGWNSWGAHWQVIIGYDDMGTEGTNDDVLILMDKWRYKAAKGRGIRPDRSNLGDFSDDHKIPYGDAAEDLAAFYPEELEWVGDNGLAGAATGGYERSGDHDKSPYYGFFDWSDMKSTDSLTLLEGFRTTQQVTEWTCGPSSALMVVDWFGMNPSGLTELDLAQMRQGGMPGATLVDGQKEIFANLNCEHGQDWVCFSMRDYFAAHPDADPAALIPELLAQGIPMMIAWDEWGGHWQVIIGYDNMGTEATQDDVLVLADSYDTTDHNQDGYFLESFERLVFGWTFLMDEDGAFVVAYPESQFPGVDFLD